jgi:hypothetical protein
MRTPDHEVELAHGFLLTGAVITGVADARYSAGLPIPEVDDGGRNTNDMLDVGVAQGCPRGDGRGARRRRGRAGDRREPAANLRVTAPPGVVRPKPTPSRRVACAPRVSAPTARR